MELRGENLQESERVITTLYGLHAKTEVHTFMDKHCVVHYSRPDLYFFSLHLHTTFVPDKYDERFLYPVYQSTLYS